MAASKTTGSKSILSEQSEAHEYYGADDEFPQLDDNDVWLYQLTLEAFIRRNSSGMASRQMTMLRTLCAQARRKNITDGD